MSSTWLRAAVAPLVVVALALPSSAGASQPPAEFIQTWNQATRSYRTADFQTALQTITPLLDAGYRLDEPRLRLWFYRDAAAISCHSGRVAEAVGIAQAATAYSVSLTSAERSTIPNNMGLITDLGQFGSGRHTFSTPGPNSDYRLASGKLIDWNENGQIDDVGTIDVAYGILGDAGYHNTIDLNLNGGDDGCAEGVPQALRDGGAASVTVARNGSGFLPVSCTSTVRCGRRVQLLRRGVVLGAGGYSISPGKTGRAGFRLSDKACDLAERLGGTFRATIAVTAGDPDKPAISKSVELRVTGGCTGDRGIVPVRLTMAVDPAVSATQRGAVLGTGCERGRFTTVRQFSSDGERGRVIGVNVVCADGGLYLSAAIRVTGQQVTGSWSVTRGTRRFSGFRGGGGTVTREAGSKRLVFSGLLTQPRVYRGASSP